MHVVIPCAGRSSRYPWTRPKFLLTMPDGRLMFQWAAEKYIKDNVVTFVITEQHAQEFDAKYAIEHVYKDNPNVLIKVLADFTAGPAETAYMALKDMVGGPIIIQDCDSFFDYNIGNGDNFVCYIKLQDYPEIDYVASKGFIAINEEEDSLRNIVEKKVISENICVGAYGFSSAKEFCRTFEELRSSASSSEIFVSHIVKKMLLNSSVFVTKQATNYFDLGTYESYVKVRNKYSTYFVDLDGVIFKNQSEHFTNNYSVRPIAIQSAVDHFLKLQRQGATLIFTTSRPNKYAGITENALRHFGFKDFRVIYGLPHSPRVLVNDVSKTNPFPSATAINPPRDSDEFWRAMS
jgi:hypothetical protein